MNVIRFEKASLWYGEVIALNEVSFEFKPGITGLVGSNGAGKTTAIKLAASLLKPTLGAVTINGEDVWRNNYYLMNMGYSPEVDRQFNFLTGRKFLEWCAKLSKMSYSDTKRRVNEVLTQIGMTHAADRLIEGYSRGMRQRIKVGQSLLHKPQIILADEPLAGTDPIGRNIIVQLFKNMVEESGTTIVVSSHVLHELERISDRIIVLESGKLVAEGKVRDVRKALSRIPQRLEISTDDPRRLAKLIMDKVNGIEIKSKTNLVVEISDSRKFVNFLSELSSDQNVEIYEIKPLDEDLTSVFKLIKNRRLKS